MPTDDITSLQAARELAARAAEVAARLKPGTWESVQALALASLAASAVAMAARGDDPR